MTRGVPRVWVEFTTHDDPLATTVAALPVPDPADLFAVPVGRREDGSPWLLRLLGTHVLVVGVTGAGKGSVVWSLLRGIASAIRGGVVAVWAIDPKGGMELGFGRGMFARFATDPADIVALLEQAVAEMRDRAARLAGKVRLHTPTNREPLVLVLVDEIASLTAYLADRDLKRRAEAALSLLLSQGRAVGVSVVGAVQDPRKEVLNLRNLFPTRVALRLDESTQVDMVLGDGAYERGAACDLIPEATPGVGYVRLDGQREPVRVRAAYVTDTDIQSMAGTYRAGASSGLRSVRHGEEAA